MIPRRTFLLLFFAFTVLATVIQRTGWSQATMDAAFQAKAERLESAILRRPRAGATFDLWRDHYLAAGARDAWLERAEKLRTMRPEQASAWILGGLVNESQREWTEAEAAYARAAELAPTDHYPAWRRAEVLLRQDQLPAAVNSLRSALDRHPPRVEMLPIARQLAALYQRTGDSNSAIAVYQQLAEQFPQDGRMLSELAQQLEQAGGNESAMEMWQRVVAASRGDEERFDAELQIARLQQQVGDTRASLANYTRLLDRVQPDSWRAEPIRRQVNLLLESVDEPESRVRFWQERVDRDPSHLAARQELAEALAARGRMDEAEVVYREALARAPDQAALQQGLLQLLTQQGKYSAAIAWLEQSLETDGNATDRRRQLGELHLRRADIGRSEAQELAVKAWQAAIASRPADASLATQLATLCSDHALTGQAGGAAERATEPLSQAVKQRNRVLLDAAESFWREAIRREPSASSWQAMGELLHRLGRSEEAIEAWKQMAGSDAPQDWLSVAKTLDQYGYTRQALEAAARATEVPDATLAAWQQRVELLLDERRHDDALASLDSMLAQRPADEAWRTEALLLRSLVQQSGQRVAEELAALTALWQQSPPDVAAGKALATLLEKQNDHAQASAIYDTLLSLRPNDHTARRNYAKFLRRSNRTADAIEQYQRLVTSDRQAPRDDYRRLIELQLEAKQREAADQTAQQLIRRMPSDPESHLMQAEVARARENSSGYLAALQRAVRVAPKDVQVRRRYALALLDADRGEEAAVEAMEAIVGAESVADQQALLAWFLSWATPAQHRTLADNLARQRATMPANADLLSRSLVTLWQHLGDSAQAIAELESLHRQQPNDREILQQLIQAMVRAGNLPRAIEYQRILARLEASPVAHEQLARLLRQNGQTDEARDIWDGVLDQPASLDETLRLLSGFYQRQDLYAAQQLTEAMLSRFPDDPTLAYHAALLHLALDQTEDARRAFERLARSSNSAKPVSTGDSTGDAIESICAGLDAHRFFASLHERTRRFGIRHPRTIDFLFSAEDSLLPATREPRFISIYSLVALLVMADPSDPANGADDRDAMLSSLLERNHAIQNGDAAQSRQRAEVCAIAAWATFEFDQAMRLLDLDSDPTTAASDVVGRQAGAIRALLRLLTPPVSDESPAMYLNRLRLSLTVLEHTESRSADTRSLSLQNTYVGMLSLVDDRQQLAERVANELAQSANYRELVVYAPLLTGLPDEAGRDVARRLLNRLEELPESMGVDGLASSDQITALGYLLQQLSVWQAIPASERLSAVRRLLRRFLALHAIANEQQDPRNASVAILPTSSTDGDAWETPLRTIERKIGLAWAADRSLQASRGTAARSPIGNSARRSEQVAALMRSLPPNWPGRPNDEIAAPIAPGDTAAEPQDAFPAAPPWLSDADVNVLRAVASLGQSPEEQALILDSADAALEGQTSTPGTIRIQLAQALLRWHWDRKAESIAGLTTLADQFSENPGIAKITLDRLIADARLIDARTRWHAMPNEWRGEPPFVELGDRLWRQWSNRASAGVLEGHTGAVLSLAIDANGRYLASAGVDGTVRVWELDSGELVQTFRDHQDIVLAVAFSPDGTELASAAHDRQIRRRRIADWSTLPTLTGHSAAVRCLDYHPTKSQLVSGGDDRKLVVWDLLTGRAITELSGHTDMVLAVRFDVAGNELVSTGNDRSIRHWQLAANPALQATGSTGSPARALAGVQAVEQHATTWIAGTDHNELSLWNWRTGVKPVSSMRIDAAIRSLAVLQDTSQLAIGREDHLVQLWDLTEQREISRLLGHTGRVMSIVDDPSRRQLITASFDGTIRRWKLDVDQP
jgi:WD40 repeat protein/tetratricopeptide (TPR) repeat protein